MYQSAKAELVDLQSEQQREMEGLLDNVRSMTRELRLQMLAIDSFVPTDYQVRTEESSMFVEDLRGNGSIFSLIFRNSSRATFSGTRTSESGSSSAWLTPATI